MNCPELKDLEENAMEFKKVFQEIIPRFHTNHGKVYYALFSSETKTAEQIAEQTKICRQTVYRTLTDLIKWQLTQKNNCNPTNYFIKEPMKIYQQKTKNITKKIETSQNKLEEMIQKTTEEQENLKQKFMIVIGPGTQTKLVNYNTKKEVKKKHEIQYIRKQLDCIKTQEKCPSYRYCGKMDF